MEPPSKWYPLPNFPGSPALLVSARFGKSSYTLHVTDLANVWAENLDRRGILFRSLQENTSIDLVDADPEQWAVFLSKLQAAFDPASPDHSLTSLSIAADSHQDGLTLRITCELPKPLEPLKWPVHLLKCPPVSLASELVLPLIQGHYTQHRETEDLMNQLKEKDALITKLLDKLNTMHTPLELVFNSLSAKQATSRAAAEERIKGLAPFNEENWRAKRNIETPKDAQALLRAVFSDSGFSCAANTDLGVSDTLNTWWTKLGSEFRAASRPENSPPHAGSKEKERISKDSPEARDNDEFQVQVTPTRRQPRSPASGKSTEGKAIHETAESDGSDVSNKNLARPQNKPRSKIGTLGNTKTLTQHHSPSQSSRTLRTDEDDTASESEHAEEQSTPSRHTRKSNPRLGTIGRSKASPQPTSAVNKTEPSTEENDETASGSDSDSGNSLKPRPSLQQAPTTPRKATLGRIGGKSNDNTSPPGQKKSTSDATSDGPASPKKAEVRKIGAIGRKPNSESKRVHPDPPAEPEEPETDEQKAERKRAELAKELNRQSAVPARKKRKF
ncbi:hypothetical protein O1611_g1110 [Lasiodiplodia mahajangana]|uniref:Uncharacterized protein n=1 Tax=Lasiodiplodia mahajangana TaxID=1108764 RepID=A0ACC2JYE0_9PEZI|nr:hypothetical protein O1611_g1110 [Lasiodiplodia mahajangana]